MAFTFWGHWQTEKIVASRTVQSKNRVISQKSYRLAAGSETEFTTHFPPLSLETVFNPDFDQFQNLSSDHVSTLIAAGDVMLGRAVNSKSFQRQDYTWPFEKIASLLKQADMAMINLESPFLSDCPLTSEGMKFCGDSHHVQGLELSGIDLVNLANNHFSDQETEGMLFTEQILNEARIKVVGLNKPAYQKIKGIVFAFLGYNQIYPRVSEVAWAEARKVVLEVSEAEKKADVLVVSFHWGKEYTDQPNFSQRELAHLAIDAGADLVIGHHPHWTQPVEIYKGKVIVYSLGNFIFDQTWSRKTQEGFIGRFTFFEDQLVKVEFLPVMIKNLGQPELAFGAEKERLLKELEKISNQWTDFQE